MGSFGGYGYDTMGSKMECKVKRENRRLEVCTINQVRDEGGKNEAGGVEEKGKFTLDTRL